MGRSSRWIFVLERESDRRESDTVATADAAFQPCIHARDSERATLSCSSKPSREVPAALRVEEVGLALCAAVSVPIGNSAIRHGMARPRLMLRIGHLAGSSWNARPTLGYDRSTEIERPKVRPRGRAWRIQNRSRELPLVFAAGFELHFGESCSVSPSRAGGVFNLSRRGPARSPVRLRRIPNRPQPFTHWRGLSRFPVW